MDRPSAGPTFFSRDVTVYIRMGYAGYTGLGYGLQGLNMGSGGPEKKQKVGVKNTPGKLS